MSLAFYFFRIIAWIVSRLPMPVVYLFSGALRILLRYVLRYRRKVILENLERSFPDKGRKEIRKIMGDFYRNLADVAMEVMKLEGIDREELLNRFQFNGYEIMERSFSRGRNVIVAIGHCGNWEWMGTALGLISPVKGYAIVKPLSKKTL